MFFRTLRATGVTLGLAAVCGCAAPPAELPRVAEPTEALRPEPLRGSVPADARIADYVLDARLDAGEHRLDGTARVTWRNTTRRTVDSLPFHLYMNGFRAEDTAWMRTSRGWHRRSGQEEEGAWGWIDVRSVRHVDDGSSVVAGAVENPPRGALAFREDADPSTMTVTLAQPVGPGESVTVEIAFVTQLPRVVARTGYAGDFHAVGQWYPKIGVLEEEAGWQAHTFTLFDEFYADFGNYDVVLDVPERMIVGATGIRAGEEVSAGRKRLTYAAEIVHDFAWFADPDFVEHSSDYHGIRIRQLIQPERVGDAEAHLAAQLAALESYESRYGAYPWSTITIVHPPEDAEGATGMEYPTLFTTSDRAAIPAWVRATVFDERMSGTLTTVHEFGHQYFQGLFASREHVEPWLDEGLNTTSNALAAMDRLGEDPWITRFLSQKIYLRDFLRAGLKGGGYLEPIDRPAKEFDSLLGNYGATIYGRTAAVMLTLRNLVGKAAFDRALRAYCDHSRFRHPRGEHFEAILAEELGGQVNLAAPGEPPVHLDVSRFFDQALRTTRQVDFELFKITHRRRAGEAGWHRGAGGELEGGEPPDNLDLEIEDLDDEDIEGLVAVRRAGAFELPVELLIEFVDGDSELLTWNAEKDMAIFSWPGRRIRRASLDPENKLLLEWNRLDNSRLAAGVEDGPGLGGLIGNLAEALGLALMGSLGP